MKLLATVLFLAVSTSTGLCSAVQIGSLVTTQHLVSGTVYVDNNSTIRIENFNYDGLGPDAYMYYYPHGVSPTPSGGGIIIPVPGGGSGGQFTFGVTFTNEQLVLTMPAGSTIHDIGHLVVWCQAFSVFFNEPLQFPAAGSIVFETPAPTTSTALLPSTTNLFTTTILMSTLSPTSTAQTKPSTTAIPSNTPSSTITVPTEPPTIVTILPLEIGTFVNLQHGIAGTVHVDNNSTIRIENFYYDGLGPDAYMYYYPHGVTPTPSGGGIIIPIPGGGSGGRFTFGRAYSNEQLILTMPAGTTVHDIGRLVIWCQAFRVFFNSPMQFPNPLVFPTNTTTVVVTETPTQPSPTTTTTDFFTTTILTNTPSPTNTVPTEPPTVVIITILPLEIGTFVNLQHGIAGTVHVDNNSTIRIENFHYDGLGPDAYMYYYPHGVTPTPTGGGIIIPVPASAGGGNKGQFSYGRAFSNEQLILTMPAGTTVHDIGRLVIWCKLASVFFNSPMQFPNPLVFPTNTTSVVVTETPTQPSPATTEPPTIIVVTMLPLKIGTFVNLQHGIAGTVYADNNSTIRIENFHYDGLGPDAYMYYYPHGVTASGPNGVKIPIPASAGGGNGGQFGTGSANAFNNEQLVLTMPAGTTVHDIGHLVIWCQAFDVFFNSPMQFPNPLVFPTNTTTVVVTETPTQPSPTTTEPPTIIVVTMLPLEIGTFVNLQHGIAGTVYADNNSTIRIENFHYDGLGPDAYMYYYPHGVTASGPNGVIIPIPASAGGGDGGQFGTGSANAFNNEQLILTMPAGTTVHDIGHLVIWCQAFDVFFNSPMQFPNPLVFPTNTTTVIVNTTTPTTTSTTPATTSATSTTPTNPSETVPNCVPLSDKLQLTWSLNTTVTKPSATFTLCGCLRAEQYMSFGLSGKSDSVNMVNGDVTVAWVDSEPHAEDYFLERREQCRDGVGVCPDKTSARGGTCREDNFNISSTINNGVTCITYSRHLDTGDTNCDTVLDTAMLQQTYIIWALGPLGATAFQHFDRSGFDTPALNLTREPVNQCTAAPSCDECAAFSSTHINAPEGRTFTAEIGVSGGLQGYTAITGRPGWGIAWYIDGLLVPELTLTRGQSYTFRVFGGDDDDIANRASYHPLYITDSPSGGRLLNNAEQRMSETVYAGFNGDQPTGVGTFCAYNEGTGSPTIRKQCGTVQQYLGTLVRTCNQNPPTAGEIVFRPDETTPDIVYYQCATHINLGWRINIVDPDNSSSVEPTVPPTNCVPLHDRLQLSWTLNTAASRPSATFTLCGDLNPAEEYMAFGLSGSETGTNMVGGDVTVAWIGGNDIAIAEDYLLKARRTCTADGDGVCPDTTNNEGTTCTNDNMNVHGCVQDNVMCVTYTRFLKTDDDNCDSRFDMARLNQTYIIWALGPRTNANIMQHTDRGGGYVGHINEPLNLTRDPINECPRKPSCPKPTCKQFEASRLVAPEGRSFTVDVGPSGGARGYSAITGRKGGDLAWYINGLLAPELTLTRGESYTFQVYGGSFEDDDKNGSHPFYITDSPTGGRPPNDPRQVTYAADDGDEQEEGTFCSYIETSASGSIQESCGNITQYLSSLNRLCEETPPRPIKVVFVPSNNTPDVLYYQSAAQENMGWRINIVGSTSAASILTHSWTMIITMVTIAILLFTSYL